MSRGKNELGLKRLLGLHYYVRNLERSRRFYTELLDFAEIGGGIETRDPSGNLVKVVNAN